MKRIGSLFVIFALLVGVLSQALPALAESDNLIKNSSVESVAGETPANWSQSKWGANASTLEYKNQGHTGDRSLYVSMTSRTDGDAKWMHESVDVQPNTSYTYTSWYKSDITTEIDLQYTDAAGAVSYAYADSITPSSDWQLLAVDFTTPANATKATVMHIVADAGWLQTDDFSLTSTVVAPPADQDNYIANNSFETANGANPAGWYKNSWGVNSAQFSYEDTGRTGAKSAKVTMSSFTSGDAKWYAEPSAVIASKSYLYRDYYKSTVPTRVVVAFIDASGNYSYEEREGAPASPSEWSQYEMTFVAPASAVKASVFHVIDSVGSLVIDDTNLYVGLPVSTEPVIANASFETAASGMPADWHKNNWGTNTANFEYINEGHTGAKSAKVTVSNYVDGDAKWFFNPISSVQEGKQYRFTTWYKTNVTPHAVAMFAMSDGSTRYFGMPITQPNGSTTQWQQYSDTFSVPEGAVSASVFLFISQNGWLQTDDYSLTPYSPNGFSRPLLTMTFDDGHEDNATNALPVLNQYGFKTTQCFATSFIEGKSQKVINGVKAFDTSGHEICSHTVTHPFMTTLNASTLTYEAQHSKQYLQTLIGKPVTNFATPYGDYDVTVVNELKKYYRSHRSVDEGYNSKDNFNIYNLRVQNILDTTSAEQVASWIAQAKTDNTWLILVYHRVANDPGPYDSYITTFKQHAKVISDSSITVKTTAAALDEITPQTK